MTHWEELCAVIRGMHEVASDEKLSVEDFSEFVMGQLNEAVDILDKMGTVAREVPSLWAVDLAPHGTVMYVGTSDDARKFWHGRAYALGVIGALQRRRVAGGNERTKYARQGAYEK